MHRNFIFIILIICFISCNEMNDIQVKRENHLINWLKNKSDYEKKYYNLIIANSIHNCMSCIRIPVNNIIKYINDNKYPINIFHVFEVDIKGESKKVTKHFENSIIKEDIDEILFNDFEVKSYPKLLLLDNKGKIISDFNFEDKHFQKIFNTIDSLAKSYLKNNTKEIQKEKYHFKDVNKLTMISCKNFIFKNNKIIMFDNTEDITYIIDINTKKLIKTINLKKDIYKQFIKPTDNMEVWDIAKKILDCNDYLCLSSGNYNYFDSSLYFLAKIVTGYHYISKDKNNVLIDADYKIISLRNDKKYSLINIPNEKFVFERVDNLILQNNFFYIPNIQGKKIHSKYLIIKFEKNNPENKTLLFPIDDTSYNFLKSNIFLKSNKNKFLFIDNQHSKYFTFSNDKIIESSPKIFDINQKDEIFDIAYTEKLILILKHKKLSDKIFLNIYDNHFKFIEKLSLENLTKNKIVEIKIAYDGNKNLVYFLTKEKKVGWNIYSIKL